MIYFAQFSTGAIKIGSSKNVHTRMRTLLREFRGEKPAILATIPGGRKEEREIHQRFAHLRFPKSEQFRPDRELMDFIKRPLFATPRPLTISHSPHLRECRLALTPREAKTIDKFHRNTGRIFTHRNQFVSWMIRLTHREIQENSDRGVDSVNNPGYHKGGVDERHPATETRTMTTATKSLSEMTMNELIQADIANSNAIEACEELGNLLRRRREIRAEIDRRKAQQS